MIEDKLSKICEEIYENRQAIIDLFCKTFLVSQEPRSPEELRALFEIMELTVTRSADFSETYQITLKETDFDREVRESNRRKPVKQINSMLVRQQYSTPASCIEPSEKRGSLFNCRGCTNKEIYRDNIGDLWDYPLCEICQSLVTRLDNGLTV